jgi:hypothetical protein
MTEHEQLPVVSMNDSIVAAQPAPPPLPVPPPDAPETRFLKAILFGPNGTRVGWSIAMYFVLVLILAGVFGISVSLFLDKVLHIQAKSGNGSPFSAILGECIQLVGVAGAAAICAMIERRKLLDYNLRGPSRLRHFATGLGLGFVVLSILVGALHAGGWLTLGPVTLHGADIAKFGLLWGIVFLLTGFGEEGMTRCYMQFTLSRGINYWWALGTVLCLSLFSFLNTHGSGAGGVYLTTGLGVLPCLWLQLKKTPSAKFWQAAWLTSTFFGYIHTFNKGETWIGIFSAAFIGLAFCVSIWLTGSAWWAIGFHASWDWAQTFFFGTADSGFLPEGHLFTATPVGSALWSGGSDGPEGSLLILPTTLLIILVLVVFYRHRRWVSAETSLLETEAN